MLLDVLRTSSYAGVFFVVISYVDRDTEAVALGNAYDVEIVDYHS